MLSHIPNDWYHPSREKEQTEAIAKPLIINMPKQYGLQALFAIMTLTAVSATMYKLCLEDQTERDKTTASAKP